MGYVLFDEIAAGGMAAVHFGRLSGPVGFSRVVAIKRLHKHLARERDFVSMFLDEARLAARVRHPNVVQTVDVVAEDEVFIVMEYIQGESVSRLVRAEKARGRLVPLPYTIAIMAGSLHGLHAAHDAIDERGQPLGLVHRDVSPQNILVGIDGVPRVFDFGVAKAAGRLQDTRDGSLKGKVAYMSPEQLAGRDVTRRSDIYSASVLLWELLTGRRLFEADNEAAIIPKIMSPQLVAPSVHNPEVSAAVDEIVMRGLMFDPERRYATARAMAQDLERKGGLVAPSEIGEWVSELAHKAIAKRAGRIADIESRDISEASSGQQQQQPFMYRTGNSNPPTSGNTNTPSGQHHSQAPSAVGGPGSGSSSGTGTGTIPPNQMRRMFTDPSAGGPVSAHLRQYAPEDSTRAVPGMVPQDPRGNPNANPSSNARMNLNQGGTANASGGYPVAPPELATQGAMSLVHPPAKRRGGTFVLLLLSLLLLGGGGFAVWRYGPRGAGLRLGIGTPSASVKVVPSAIASGDPQTPPQDSAGVSQNGAPSASGSTATSPSSGASTKEAMPPPTSNPVTMPSTAPSTTPTTSPTTAPTTIPTTRPTGHGTAKPPPSAKPKTDECDPPYVIDADGHKNYKRNCLQ